MEYSNPQVEVDPDQSDQPGTQNPETEGDSDSSMNDEADNSGDKGSESNDGGESSGSDDQIDGDDSVGGFNEDDDSADDPASDSTENGSGSDDFDKSEPTDQGKSDQLGKDEGSNGVFEKDDSGEPNPPVEIPERVVDDGVYLIESSLNYQQVLDAANGGSSNGTNVQTWQSNMTAAQKWRLTYDAKTGYYTVGLEGTGMVLDITYGSARDGANVQLYQANGSSAQLWRIVKRGGGYVFVSGLRNDLVLDLVGAGSYNGANLQAYTSNGSGAQLFYLLPTKVAVKPGEVIEGGDGSYVIVAGGANGSYAVDIDSASLANGANAQIYQANGTAAQRFYFASDGQGYYTITSLATGQALTVAGNNLVPTTNVHQWTTYNGDTQKWALAKNADGSYSIINKFNGLALDIAYGNIGNNANVQLFLKNGTAAQKFWLKSCGTAVIGDTVLDLDGVYLIESSLNYQQVLDAANGGSSNGTNVQTWQSNMTAAQKWRLTYDAKTGYYTVGLEGTGMVLDITYGSARDGANVQLYQANGSSAQLWRIVKRGGGYVFVSGLRNDLVLDLVGAGSYNGANLQAYTSNGSGAQLFYLLPTKVAVKPGEVIEGGDGSYVIVAGGANGSYAVDIDSASLANGANAQIYQANGTAAQRFYFASDGQGYYTITSLATGQALTVAGNNLVPTTNVHQWTTYNGDTQKWALAKNADGSYSIINKFNGLALDIAYGNIGNNANVQLFLKNGTAAQKFWLKATAAISDGIYEVRSLGDVHKVFDIANASSADGAKLQLWESNGTLAQRFQVVYDAGTDSYRIRTAASGGWLTVKNGSIVQSGDSKTAMDDYNAWKLVWNGNFFSFANPLTNMVMGYSGSLQNGAAMQALAASKLVSQHFLFTAAQLIANGIYEVKSALGTNLDVAGGSSAAGANIQTWYRNDDSAQKFFISASGDGYVIKNAISNLALDVGDASRANGANVQQWIANGTKAQLWKAEIADGGYITFVNANSGLALDIFAGSAQAGANVQQYTKNGSAAQNWKVEVTTITWANIDGTWYFYYESGGRQAFTDGAKYAWEKAKDKGSETNFLITVDNNNYRTVIFQRSWSGKWEPIHDWLCGVGSPTLGYTFRGESYVMKKGPVMGIDPQEYWWTEFFNNGADPTGEGQRFHSILYWRGSYTNVYEDGRGGKNTHGCVRLLLEEAKWIYDYIPYGTKVYSF